MNIKTIIVGSLALGLAFGATVLKINSEETKAVYTPRLTNTFGQAGYAEYLNMLKADPATGKIDFNLVEQVRNEVFARSKQNNKALLGLNWIQMGPDNVGGRTRAILVDRNNPNLIYAGSISGGLFVSTNAGGSWTPIAGMQGVLGENLAISCIAQTDNGRIFFGTGSSFETGANGNGGSAFLGNGLYEYVPSSGAVVPILNNTASLPANSSGTLSVINAIATRGNRIYIGTTSGMRFADPDGGGNYPSTLGGWTNNIESVPGFPETGTCQDIDVASNGSMVVSFAGKIYTAPNDNLGSFVRRSILSGTRISCAIAPSDPNVIYMLVGNNTGNFGRLQGLEISTNAGASWDVIVPPGSFCNDPFLQNDCDPNGGQAFYDMAIAVNPADWGHILVGGIQLYEWRYASGSNPIGGSWLKAANLFESTTNPYYVHADKHTIIWPTANTVYIGCDGGVFKSSTGGTTWQEKNLGYNVTTFYDMQVAANGFFMGGAQDNGTQLFSYGAFGSPTPLGTFEISGGDGFDCAFSRFEGGIAYHTSQSGTLMRSNGGTPGTFYSSELSTLVNAGGQAFHTVIENWESADDPLSVDFIKIVIDSNGYINAIGDTIFPGDTIFAGDTIRYTSLTGGIPLYNIPTSNIIIGMPSDSFNVVDYIQSKFAFRTSQGIYLTRDAARLNAINTKWFKISGNSMTPDAGTLNSAEHFEFSPDGNHLFIGTSNGQVWRISGLSLANDSLGLDERSGSTVLTQTRIASGLGGGSVVSIAVDPNNGNNIIATAGGYSTQNHVYRCTDALTAPSTTTLGTFTAIQGVSGNALPKMPVYDAEIDYNDRNKVVLGTEWGVWTSDNAFTASASAVRWIDESGAGMAHVPVFAVEQQNLRSHTAVNSGCMYLGTHARGFYMACDLATSVNENNFNDKDKTGFITNLTVYPNPVNNAGTIAFDLKEKANTKVNIYNLSGSLVKTIDLGIKTEGNHKVKFDATSLSIGSYIISLQSGNEKNIAKFIVTR